MMRRDCIYIYIYIYIYICILHKNIGKCNINKLKRSVINFTVTCYCCLIHSNNQVNAVLCVLITSIWYACVAALSHPHVAPPYGSKGLPAWHCVVCIQFLYVWLARPRESRATHHHTTHVSLWQSSVFSF